MSNRLDINCDTCNVPLTVTAESAAHDINLVDVVVSCISCGSILNDFIHIDAMLVVNKGKEQPNV